MLLGLFLVALFWGVTNPFLKHYSTGITSRRRAASAGVWADFRFLLSSRGYVASLLINWIGSVLFYVMLADGDLSVVVPVCNSLTFGVTLVCGYLAFGERISGRTLVGLGFIVAGIVCMV